MTIDVLHIHSAWPSYFDIDVLVYCDDWSVDAAHALLILRPDSPHGAIYVSIDSITPLPDGLIFIRGQYLPEDDDDEPTTYYGIAAHQQYAERIRCYQ